AQAAVHGLQFRFDRLEDIRDLADADDLALHLDRPHGREVRFGNSLGFWCVGLSEGIHFYTKDREPGVPLHFVDDLALRKCRGAVGHPYWYDDPTSYVHIAASTAGSTLPDAFDSPTTPPAESGRDDFTGELHLAVPPLDIGRLIGAEGANVKAIAAATGARVSIAQAPDDGRPASVRIAGDRPGAHQALAVLTAMVGGLSVHDALAYLVAPRPDHPSQEQSSTRASVQARLRRLRWDPCLDLLAGDPGTPAELSLDALPASVHIQVSDEAWDEYLVLRRAPGYRSWIAYATTDAGGDFVWVVLNGDVLPAGGLHIAGQDRVPPAGCTDDDVNWLCTPPDAASLWGPSPAELGELLARSLELLGRGAPDLLVEDTVAAIDRFLFDSAEGGAWLSHVGGRFKVSAAFAGKFYTISHRSPRDAWIVAPPELPHSKLFVEFPADAQVGDVKAACDECGSVTMLRPVPRPRHARKKNLRGDFC
ncbi:unnamed protein product, partial [Prorocentrum cordatum]